MSHTFVVTRDIPCIGASAPSELESIPKGSTVSFIGSPAPNHVAVSWDGHNVTILARDFAESTEATPLAIAAELAS